jgi:hypothetical protein
MVTIRNHKCLLLHGDDIPSWNSIPWYGIQRSLLQHYGLIEEKFNYYIMGHQHTSACIDSEFGEILINGGWAGPSLLALKKLRRKSRPSQWFFGMNDKYGITWKYKLLLDLKEK